MGQQKRYSQLKLEFFLGVRVFNSFHFIVEDCRHKWDLHILPILKHIHQTSLSHCPVSDDHEFLVFCHDKCISCCRSTRAMGEARRVLSTNLIASPWEDDNAVFQHAATCCNVLLMGFQISPFHRRLSCDTMKYMWLMRHMWCLSGPYVYNMCTLCLATIFFFLKICVQYLCETRGVRTRQPQGQKIHNFKFSMSLCLKYN